MTSARGLARALARRAGRSYVAGRGIAELERVRGAAERRGFACDVCYWPLPGEPPESVARNYAAALEVLAQTRTGARLAVKASQVGFEPATLEPRLDRARRADLPVIYDALEAGESDGVFRMISAALNSGVTLGCALAGRWPRSVADLEWALEHGLHVRLVKGQYADPDHPDADPRAGFLRLVDALAGRAPFVSVATHEPALAREALQRLRRAGTPCELELLYGFPLRRQLRAVRDLDIPVRLYIPYGFGRTPYPPRAAVREARTARFFAGDVLIGPARVALPLPSAR
jgi:proline dehydrogenase